MKLDDANDHAARSFMERPPGGVGWIGLALLGTPLLLLTGDLPGDQPYLVRPTPGLGFDWVAGALAVAGIYLLLVALSGRWWVSERWIRPADTADAATDTVPVNTRLVAAEVVAASKSVSDDSTQPEARATTEAVESMARFQVRLLAAPLYDVFKDSVQRLRQSDVDSNRKTALFWDTVPLRARVDGPEQWKIRCKDLVPSRALDAAQEEWRRQRPEDFYDSLVFVAKAGENPESDWIFNLNGPDHKPVQIRVTE
ncbi:hypothetical protein QQX09_02110 [Demequina sp. SYSU T00192]|uniref:Uncharacterized protein n=1 Tax=Demequina litoralis TaxID=3051660 RepID=A0ABT8G6F0_9MICO|nr:hypothetical protein [Demequina sp. SYSU T00192]MDN4474642.1 hypothetical protein [Demequina sp. SYSU T00192]